MKTMPAPTGLAKRSTEVNRVLTFIYYLSLGFGLAETESGLPSPPPEAAGPCDRPPDRLSLLRQREHVLGRSLDVGLGLLGAAFLLSSLGRILGIGGGEATSAQFVLAGFALVLIGLAAWHAGSRLVGALRAEQGARGARLLVGLMPLLALLAFLPFRLRITDIEAYKSRVAEGSVVEWLSFLFLLAAGGLFLLTGRRQWQRGQRGVAVLFLVMGTGSLAIAMEEMSWGQTIFNWRTPDFFNAVNVQHETNLHNLAPFNDYIWIATAKIFSLITLLILLRLALGSRLKPLSMADALLPTPILFAYFFLAALIYVGVAVEKLGIDVPVLVTREQEVAECLFALAVLLHAGRCYLRWAPRTAAVSSGRP